MDLAARFTRAGSTTGVPGVFNNLLQELEQRISISTLGAAAEGETALITKGPTFPAAKDNKLLRVHFLTDRSGLFLGIGTIVGGAWVLFAAGARIGQFSYFLETTAPAGWYLANGDNGTINVQEGSPEVYDLGGLGQIYLYQYTGVV